MKRKLLNEIDFSTIIPLSNNQIIVLKGGGVKETVKVVNEEIGRNYFNCNCYIIYTNNCAC